MNGRELAERIGNIDGYMVQQAERLPDYGARRRRKWAMGIASCAAVFVLAVGSFTAGAVVFAKEMSAEPEMVTLEEIGLTLLLPDTWKENYSVEVGEMEGGYLYTFYDNTIHGQGGEWTESGALFFIGTYGDTPMTEAEMDAAHHHAYAYEYLFSTRTTNYIMVCVSDMQYDPGDPDMSSHYEMMVQGISDIRFVLDNVL